MPFKGANEVGAVRARKTYRRRDRDPRPSVLAPQLASGKLRAFAVSAPKRLGGALSSIPTWKEQGLDMVEGNWRGIVGPKGLRRRRNCLLEWNARRSGLTNRGMDGQSGTQSLGRRFLDRRRSQAFPRYALRRIAVYFGELPAHRQVANLRKEVRCERGKTRPVSSQWRGANPAPRRNFVRSLRFDELPREVVSKAKLCILDTLGCCIFGASLQPAAEARRHGCGGGRCATRDYLRYAAADKPYSAGGLAQRHQRSACIPTR